MSITSKPGEAVARRIQPSAAQEAFEFCGMLSDLVAQLHEQAQDGDEDAALRLLGLRDELQSVVGETRGA